MLRGSVLGAVSRLTVNNGLKNGCGRVLMARPGFVGKSATIAGIRFKSTESVSSGTVTQLPSIEEIENASSSIGDQISQVASMTSDQIGYMNSVGLAQSWWWPPDVVQHLMEMIHVYSGLPWWGTICTVTVLVRLLMFPLYVKSSDNIAKNSRIKPQLDQITSELMSATDMTEGQKIALKRKKLLADNGIKNRWALAPMLQLPLALGFFGGIRHMASVPVEGFTTQGTGWFTDLTLADPYLGLQVITASVLISFTRLGGETGAQQFSPAMKRVFTILPLVSIPATMSLSSGVVLYFAVNGIFSVIQTLILRNKWFRKKLNIADVVIHPIDPNKPQKGILDSLRENMAKAREQGERRQMMQAKEKAKQELVKKQKAQSRVKVVRRSDFKN